MADFTRFNTYIPRDATRISEWMLNDHGEYFRLFDGAHRQAGGMFIDILGAQLTDGTVIDRWVIVSPADYDDPDERVECDAARARQFAHVIRTEAQAQVVTEPEAAAEGFNVAAALTAAAGECEA
jgi:hypothetical protein